MRVLMASYVPATAQLVAEVFVRDMARAKAFYQALGFTVTADRDTFVVLTWEGHELYLDQRPDLPPPPQHPQANIRVMVPDVDRYWALAQSLDARVLAPIADRDYGLRDFTILDPDGFGIRFGTRLPSGHA
jgi:catechol 2,3-dioxygenase-like lactoylglutathione lyase family enzyme